jgi:DNA-directed RNA polymerase subunit RPC12/RpoP
MSDPILKRTMYRVEKFLPLECPKCRHGFQNEATDWFRLLGDVVDGNKVVRETAGYSIIICSKCNNYTACVPLESWQTSSQEKANRLFDTEGFINFLVVTGYGDHTKDMHTKAIAPDGTETVPECPQCRRKFDTNLLSEGDIIVCQECGNHTMKFISSNGVKVMSVKCN